MSTPYLKPYAWMLEEEILVTVTDRRDDDDVTILVARTTGPGAVTIRFSEGRVLLNGLYADLGDDFPVICGIADEACVDAGSLVPAGISRLIDPISS